MLDWLVNKVTEAGQQFRSRYVIHTTPNIPYTSSNLTVVCYRDESRKNVVPIRVKWYRIKNGQQHYIHSMKGSAYPCEPSDLGCTIRAEVQTLEEYPPYTNNIMFGPIRMDINLKNVLTGILSTGHSNFDTLIVNGGLYKELKLAICNDTVKLTYQTTSNQFSFYFNLAYPRIELNPKDICRLYIRFRDEDKEQELKIFLNRIFDGETYMYRSNRSQSSLARSVFRVDGRLYLRMLTRNNRDLLLFTLKAFAAQRDMKACSVVYKIYRIDLTKYDLFHIFFHFYSLRTDILQLHNLNQSLIIDRDKKIRDLKNMEDEIGSIRAGFYQIINQQLMQKNINLQDLNQSYSSVSKRADELQSRNRVKELEEEKKRLELRIKVLMEEVDTLKFFKNPNNQSLLSEESIEKRNPFEKKKIVIYRPPIIRQLRPSLSMLNESKVHAQDFTTTVGQKNTKIAQYNSMYIYNLLEHINESEQKYLERVKKYFAELSEKYENLQKYYEKITNYRPPEPNYASLMSITHTSLNESMTSEAGVNLLVQKVHKMTDLQYKLVKANYKLENYLNHIKYYRDRLQTEIHKMRTENMSSSMSSSTSHLVQQIEQLQDERRNLQRKIDLISAEASKVKNTLVLYRQIEYLEQVVRNGNRRIAELEQELAHNRSNSHNLSYSRLFHENGQRMKEINEGLLKQIKDLYKKLEKQKNGYVLLNDSSYMRDRLSSKQETIDKVRSELKDKQKSYDSSDGGSAKKYIRRIKQLEYELNLARRSAYTMNRSRDLSMSMEQYLSYENERLKTEVEALTNQIEKISYMCEKYSKEARYGQKARQENVALKKELAELKQK